MIAQCRYCLELIDGGPAPAVSAEAVAALKAGLVSPDQAGAPAASANQAGGAGRKRRRHIRFGRVRGPAAAQQKAALPAELLQCVSGDLTCEDLRGLLEWQQLGRKLFHHLGEAHPEKAGAPLYWVTVVCNFLLSLHFSGAGDFGRWQTYSQEQAIAEIGKPIAEPVADAQPKTA